MKQKHTSYKRQHDKYANKTNIRAADIEESSHYKADAWNEIVIFVVIRKGVNKRNLDTIKAEQPIIQIYDCQERRDSYQQSQ